MRFPSSYFIKQAADARGCYDWPHESVYEAASRIAGKGLHSKRDLDKKQVVFSALLPDEDVSDAFAHAEYSCYKHIVHKDGASALAIDPGSNMAGNVWACKNDCDIRYLRLLNHCKTPNVKLLVGDAATPHWFEPVGDVKYGPWYTCLIVTEKSIKAGDELVIRYADAPAEWDEDEADAPEEWDEAS